MPFLKPSHIDRLIAAFAPEQKRAIIVPVKGGQRGNPTLWARCFFAEMMGLEGDMGGRNLITRHADQVFEVAMEDDAVLADIDTPDALAKARKDGGA
jgi:molybdenum cofactor cytidylyltransferase